MIRTRSTVILAALAAAGVPSCTLATASPGFEERAPRILCGSSGAIRDLVVELTGFSAHGMHSVRGDVVNVTPSGRILVGRFVLDPGQVTDPRVTMPCLLDEGEQYEIDLSADVPGMGGMPNGVLDCPPNTMPTRPECTDHQWRLEVQGDGRLIYTHDLLFEDVSVDAAMTGANTSLDVTMLNFNAPALGLAGEPLEVHVRRLDAVAGGETVLRTVYLHRLGAIPDAPGDTFVLPRPGTFVANTLLAEPGADYEIAFWIDSNHNGTYEPPSGNGSNRDVSWTTSSNTDVGGLHPVFDAMSTEAVRVDIGL